MVKTDRQRQTYQLSVIKLIFCKLREISVVFSLLQTSEERNAWQVAAVRFCTAVEWSGVQ